MKTSSVGFDQLRRLLLDLHFTESRTDAHWRFEHAESDTVFVFRPYSLTDNVTMQDIAATRTHLDWRGLLSGEAFDDFLTKKPASRIGVSIQTTEEDLRGPTEFSG
jgi:hypothetical protein